MDSSTRTAHGIVRLGPDARPGLREFDCVYIRAGRVLREDGQESDWLIPGEVLCQAAPLFAGISSYLDHPERFGLGWRQAPSVRDLVGVTLSAAWDPGLSAIAGVIRLYEGHPASAGALVGALIDQILADRAAGRPVPALGLSAVFYQRARRDEAAGLTVTDEIAHAESVDWVYSPGAGGYVRAALARLPGWGRQWTLGAVVEPGGMAPPIREGGMTPPLQEGDMVEEKMVEGREPHAPAGDAGVAAMLARFEERVRALEARALTPDPSPGGRGEWALTPDPSPGGRGEEIARVSANVDRLLALLAGQEEGQTVQGHGLAPQSAAGGPAASPAGSAGIHVGPGSLEQVALALDALIAGTRPAGGIRPLSGIRELYMLLSGDYEMTGMYQPERVYLANVNTSTMAALVANALNKRVMVAFQEYPQWWSPVVTIEDFNSLQDVRWITLGGVGELPTVSEGAAYTEMTWDDNTETDSFVKKGGYLGLTIEGIDKDDTGRLRAAPRVLAQAAWMTLGKAIAAIHTANAALADGVALYHADHSNLGSTALSLAAWRATKVLMAKQTELNSGERLGALTAPRYLWVPIDLEDTAVQFLATEHDTGSANWAANVDAAGNERESRLARARGRVITVPFWTDASDWVAQADPQLYPSIGLGFRYGRTPEIFSVASPTAGLMFTNDTMPVKVRFFFATGPIDYRGLYKHAVA